MQSCIYRGQVRHRRFHPVRHTFAYPLFMMYLDLAELPTLFSNRWFWSVDRLSLAQFRRKDHLGDPEVQLDHAVRSAVEQRLGQSPQGPIRLLTHLRYFGYCFNPVSFYFCYDKNDSFVETIVAEITNTPWNEQYYYVLGKTLNEGHGKKKRYRFDKTFHVSPFIDMDIMYDWRFCDPDHQLTIHMEDYNSQGKIFDATMTLQRLEITTASLATSLLRYPFITGKIIAAIYFQALCLWWKRAPFYIHPSKRDSPTEAPRG
ncbi:MAG: DUF1365 domain-containing protein [Candidatus Binatia bacterium]